MPDDWKVTANLDALNRAIGDYVAKYQVDFCKVTRATSIGIVGQVARTNPVRTGRARAAWLPFLWSEKQTTQQKSKGVTFGEAVAGQRQGIRLGRFKKNLKDTAKPYAWIQNRVPYEVYLEYGVRKGAQKKQALGKAILSPVAKSGTMGFVKKAVDDWSKAYIKSVREGVKKASKK